MANDPHDAQRVADTARLLITLACDDQWDEAKGLLEATARDLCPSCLMVSLLAAARDLAVPKETTP